MPEVRRGSSVQVQSDSVLPERPGGPPNDLPSPTRPLEQSQTQSADRVPVVKEKQEQDEPQPQQPRRPSLGHPTTSLRLHSSNGEASSPSNALSRAESAPTGRRRSSIFPPIIPHDPAPRRSVSYAQRSEANAYYDSRAGTRKEWRRRARTLEEYYEDNPDLLPQLPFSWRHGNRRWRLWFFAFLVFVDASAIPIALYYGMKYAGHVEEWIIFAVVTTIWGGPTYLEFGIRTLRLVKKEHFYRPLGTTSRWCADSLTWTSSLAIFVLTALFIIGSAPHDTWLRVVAMAAPSILWTLGGVLLALTLMHRYKIPAPFRISSTAKGEEVLPGVYYFIEDTLAVNARCGRPYREALAARYRASPRFREMLYEQSLFWSIPALILALILTIIAVIPWVPENWSYGVCWVAPFVWAFIWGCITIRWCKARMVRERLEWEAGEVSNKTLGSGSTVSPSPV